MQRSVNARDDAGLSDGARDGPLGGADSVARGRQRTAVLLSRRDGCQHAEAGPAVHGLRLSRHGLRLSARALQHRLSAAMAQHPAGLHERCAILAPGSRAAARHSRPVRPSRRAPPRGGLLCPQHRSASARAAGATDHPLARARGLRGARHSPHPDAARARCRRCCARSSAVPATDQPAGAFLAGLPSQLLCGGPEISRRLVPAREQAASLDLRRRRPPCGAPPSAAGPGWSAISA